MSHNQCYDTVYRVATGGQPEPDQRARAWHNKGTAASLARELYSGVSASETASTPVLHGRFSAGRRLPGLGAATLINARPGRLPIEP